MNDILAWLGWLGALMAGVFAVRGTVRFDLNQWLKDRREQRLDAIRALCPHAYLAAEHEQVVVYSSFISPRGRYEWQCQRCGAITHDRTATTVDQRYWAENPDKLFQREETIRKLMRKV